MFSSHQKKTSHCCNSLQDNSQNPIIPETIPITVSKSSPGFRIRKGLRVGFNNIKQAWLLLDKKLARKLQII